MRRTVGRQDADDPVPEFLQVFDEGQPKLVRVAAEGDPARDCGLRLNVASRLPYCSSTKICCSPHPDVRHAPLGALPADFRPRPGVRRPGPDSRRDLAGARVAAWTTAARPCVLPGAPRRRTRRCRSDATRRPIPADPSRRSWRPLPGLPMSVGSRPCPPGPTLGPPMPPGTVAATRRALLLGLDGRVADDLEDLVGVQGEPDRLVERDFVARQLGAGRERAF